MPTSKAILFSLLIISIFINVFVIHKFLTTKDTPLFTASYDDIEFAFSDITDNPKALLLQAINDAKQTLDIAIYNIKDKEIADAILRAKKRGVSVRILTDAEKAENNKQAALLKSFSENSIEVKVNSKRKMHLKMAIIDESLIIMGSYNFTEASATENIEQLIAITNQELGAEWTKIFNRLWKKKEFVFWKDV